ncbi:hypothetical protein TURU_092331 [Turdus rufiventris]|nr:hypothetical protein TURU_092331 [Turdus rufiventris]
MLQSTMSAFNNGLTCRRMWSAKLMRDLPDQQKLPHLLGDISRAIVSLRSRRSKATFFTISLISPENTGTKRHKLRNLSSCWDSDRGTLRGNRSTDLTCKVNINDTWVNKDSLESNTRPSHKECTQSLAQRSKGIQMNLMHTDRV